MTTRRELLGSFVGRRREQRQLDRKHLRVDADCKSDADEKRKVKTPNFSRSPSLLFRVCLSSRSCARFRAIFFRLGVSLVCFIQAQWQRHCVAPSPAGTTQLDSEHYLGLCAVQRRRLDPSLYERFSQLDHGLCPWSGRKETFKRQHLRVDAERRSLLLSSIYRRFRPAFPRHIFLSCVLSLCSCRSLCRSSLVVLRLRVLASEACVTSGATAQW